MIFVIVVMSPSIPQPHDDARLLGEVVGDVLDGGVLALVQVALFSNSTLVRKTKSIAANPRNVVPAQMVSNASHPWSTVGGFLTVVKPFWNFLRFSIEITFF